MQVQSVATHTENPIHALGELDTVETLLKAYPNLFTEAQLRWALRFRDENGLAEAVFKMGKRLYLHRPTFMKWLAQQR